MSKLKSFKDSDKQVGLESICPSPSVLVDDIVIANYSGMKNDIINKNKMLPPSK